MSLNVSRQLERIALQPKSCFRPGQRPVRAQIPSLVNTQAKKEGSELLTNIEEEIKDKQESESSGAKGFGAPKPKPKKSKQASQQQKSSENDPFKVNVPDLNRALSTADKVEEGIVKTLAVLFFVFFAEGLFLAIAGFLPEAADDFAVKYVYPAFSPTLGIFLAISVVYGLLKSRQSS